MKPTLTPAILAIAALMLGATLVLTGGETSPAPPLTGMVSTNQILVPPKPAPIHQDSLLTPHPLSLTINNQPANQLLAPSKPTPIYLDKRSDNQPLQPGVYQTYPWTIILIVPGRGIDDEILAVKPNTNSIMPILKPHVEVVPKS